MSINKNSKIIISIVLAIFLVGASAWTYMEYTSDKVVNNQVFLYGYTISGHHTVSASVNDENPIYPLGTELFDMAGYFYSISPQAYIDFILSFTPSKDASIAVDINSKILLEKLDDEGNPFWSKEEHLSTNSTTLVNTSTYSDTIVLDCGSISSFFEQTEESLDSSVGSPIGTIVTSVSYHGLIGTNEVEGVKEYRLPILFGPDYYFIEDYSTPDPIVKNYYSNTTSTVSKGLSDVYLQLGAVAILALLLLIVLALGTIDKTSSALLDKNKEWISTGVYPGGDWGKEVYVPEIEDLIDIAIDSNKRVIYDGGEKLFFVIDNDILYYLIEE